MLLPLLITLCMLGVVIVGLLVMTQVINLEQLGQGICRGFLVIVLTVFGLCLFEMAVLPILICALVWLKHAALWTLIILLAVVAAIILGHVKRSRTREPKGEQR